LETSAVSTGCSSNRCDRPSRARGGKLMYCIR
jgi:hypothetical protein